MSRSQFDFNGQQAPIAEQERGKRECYYNKIRKIHSKAVLLVLFWIMMMFTLGHTVFRYVIIDVPAIEFLNARGIPATLVAIFIGPIIGWVADVYLGLYKAVKMSLWLGWIGSVACTLTELVPLLTDKIPQQATTALRLTSGIIVCIGFFSLAVISLAFAIEQMPDASGDDQSVVVHWYVWTIYVGRGLSNVEALIAPCTNLPYRVAEIYRLLITLAMVTIAICSDVLWHQWLILVPERRNTWGTIWGVLKYAVTHKYPAQRSAMTYCEDSIPSRMDLGKHKYGGPFTTEQVENVKTSIRVLAVVLSTSTFMVPMYLSEHSEETLIHHFSGDTSSSNCTYRIISTLYSLPFLVAVFIPLYEFTIHPWARNRIPQMLQRFVIGAVIVVFTSLYLLIIDAIGHYFHNTPCMFCTQVDSSQLSISYLAVLVPYNTIFALHVTITMISLFEFICAQAPYSMKGLLIGLGVSIFYASEGIASVIELGWHIGWQHTKQLVTTPSCEFWYYLFTTVLAIIGVLVMGLVAKYYKPRQRDEPNNVRMFVKDYYDRYCINSNVSV